LHIFSLLYLRLYELENKKKRLKNHFFFSDNANKISDFLFNLREDVNIVNNNMNIFCPFSYIICH
jgi:hypothetical protein